MERKAKKLLYVIIIYKVLFVLLQLVLENSSNNPINLMVHKGLLRH